MTASRKNLHGSAGTSMTKAVATCRVQMRPVHSGWQQPTHAGSPA